jgi:hypothetical protein
MWFLDGLPVFSDERRFDSFGERHHGLGAGVQASQHGVCDRLEKKHVAERRLDAETAELAARTAEPPQLDRMPCARPVRG